MTNPNTNSSAAPVAGAPARGVDAVAVIRFRDAREPEIISWRRMPEGEHPLYATPPASEAVIVSLKAENERLKSLFTEGSWQTVESEQAYKRRAEAAEAQVATLTGALTAALAFIDSHVADPDITDEMAKNWTRLQEARASLASQQEG
jgi:predicted mannosyl-3-phosphoglycerate phosphatase (HAD superfamily)